MPQCPSMHELLSQAVAAAFAAGQAILRLYADAGKLKLCLIAEGSADLYPRLAPTSEWDTAAGQAVVEVAGGIMADYGTGNRLRYSKPSLLYPFFVACRQVGAEFFNHG